jgi:hydrogenase nickel incorporation protein HypB
VTEGEDKPLKYPVMFRSADLVLINKIDLLPYLDVDLDAFRRNLQAVNPTAATLEISARTGAGLAAWCAWIESIRRPAQESAKPFAT